MDGPQAPIGDEGWQTLFMYCTRCRVLGLPEAEPREAGHE
jgi:hypothetical protein